MIDEGAAKALATGRSLLPAGVRKVVGPFERGAAVTIARLDGTTLGAGLCAYSAENAQAIAGRRTDEIEAILGHPARPAMAHRDDLVLWD